MNGRQLLIMNIRLARAMREGEEREGCGIRLLKHHLVAPDNQVEGRAEARSE